MVVLSTFLVVVIWLLICCVKFVFKFLMFSNKEISKGASLFRV
jgi:hypothetical protein